VADMCGDLTMKVCSEPLAGGRIYKAYLPRMQRHLLMQRNDNEQRDLTFFSEKS